MRARTVGEHTIMRPLNGCWRVLPRAGQASAKKGANAYFGRKHRACEHKRVRARLLRKCLTLPLLFSVSVCRLPGSSGRARVSKPALPTAPRAWWSAPRLLAGSKSSTTTSGALCAAASGRKSTPWLLAGNPPPVAVLAAFFYKPTNLSSLPPWLPPMQSCKWRLEGANCVSLTPCTGRWGCRGA